MEFLRIKFRWGFWAYCNLEIYQTLGFYLCFRISTKCYSWTNLSFLHWLIVLYRCDNTPLVLCILFIFKKFAKRSFRYWEQLGRNGGSRKAKTRAPIDGTRESKSDPLHVTTKNWSVSKEVNKIYLKLPPLLVWRCNGNTAIQKPIYWSL